MQPIWRVELFGTLKATRDSQTLTRFRTRRVALLLAYLSYFRSRDATREELGEMLWPEQDEEKIRHNLRQALHSLRQALEPPPLPTGSILRVKQSLVSLDPEFLVTDVSEFETLANKARKSSEPAEQSRLNQEAISLYRGELLPGFYEEWVLRERLKVEDLYVSCLRNLIANGKREGRHDDTILYLRRALAQEPLQEEWHSDLIEQYLKADRAASALKQFQELKQLLKTELGCEPSARSKSLGEMAKRAATISTHRAPHFDEPISEPQSNPPEPTPIARLPLQMTRFFGRQKEIQEVRSEFVEREARLVSLLGPAGTGKTRLAIEVGREISEKDGWNVWFAPLADLSEASMLLDEIADVMRARQSNIPELVDQIAASVTGDTNLLILDNLEHIIDDAVPVVAQLLERAPNLRLLITSRQSLKLMAEREYPVDPLPVPDVKMVLKTGDREELAVLAEYPSIQVFLDRSQGIRPDAQLTASNAATIAAICSKLEGIPLAIELAAGQTSSFAPSQMLKHLERRLTSLSTRRRDATARHKSLRAAIDYSFESISPNLQRFFAALSVFRGGFTVHSAAAVSLDHDQGYDACLEYIVDLQERSLVRSEYRAEAPDARFRMLESFRQYGEEHLTPEELETLRSRHAEYLLNVFPDLPEHASAEDHKLQHDRIEAEHENFVAALEFLFHSKQYETCVRLLRVMAKSWFHRGPRVIEREYIRQISILTKDLPTDPAIQIQLLRMVGTSYIRASDYAAAHRTMEQAVEIALKSGDTEQIATCYVGLSTCSGFMGSMQECFELNQKALEIVSKTNFELLERIYLGLGAVHWTEARLVQAQSMYLLAQQVSERARGGEPDPLILCNLARINFDLGHPEEAMRNLGNAMRTCQRLGDQYTLAQCLHLVARRHWLQGDVTEALATNHRALIMGREIAFGFLSLIGIRNHALILCQAEEWAVAATLLAATASLAAMHRTLDDLDFANARELCAANLSKPSFERAWAKGLGMSGDEAMRLAIQYD